MPSDNEDALQRVKPGDQINRHSLRGRFHIDMGQVIPPPNCGGLRIEDLEQMAVANTRQSQQSQANLRGPAGLARQAAFTPIPQRLLWR